MAMVNNHYTSFNNTDVTTVPGLTILSVDSHVIPKRMISSSMLARMSKAKVSSAFFGMREITVKVGISRDTRALVEQSIDALNYIMQGIEKDLVIKQSGELRRYTATLSDQMYNQDGGAYSEIELVFTCSEAFGYALPYEKLLDQTGRTLYNYTDPLTLSGGADTQAPIITAFLSALSGSTTNAVQIGNVGTGKFITVSRSWTAGDRLVIDCQNRTVKVNGSNVDFVGAFPDFAPGIGYLNYNDNFSTRTLALSAYYYRRYL